MCLRFALLVSLLLLTLVSSACSPKLGTPRARWVLVQTEHFRVHTDLPPARAKEQALEIERIFRAFLDHGWVHNGTFPLMLNAVLFSDPYELERYVGLDVAGYAPRELLFEPWIMLAAPRRVDGLDVLRHELTHYIAHQAIPHQPQWFAEGIAGYFETANFVNDTDFEVGSVPRPLYRELQRNGLLPMSRLWTRQEGIARPRFYATSWALVHYLMTEHADEFVAYQDGLARGLADEAAWKIAFPNLPRDRMDAKLRAYLMTGSYEKVIMRVPKYPMAATVHDIDRAGQYALDGLLWLSCAGCGEREHQRSRESFALALLEDPQQPQALAMQTLERTRSDAQALSAAQLAAKRHPEEWLAWAALAQAQARAGTMGDVSDADAVAHLVKLAPRNPYTWIFSALQHASRGRRDLALRDVSKVRRMAPTNVTLLHWSANLLQALSACEPLRDVGRSLNELSHTGVSDTILREVARWNAACHSTDAAVSAAAR